MLSRTHSVLRPLAAVRPVIVVALPRRLVSTQTIDHGDQTLYPGHIPLSMFQRSLLTVGSALGALITPTNGERLAMLGDATAFMVLRRLRDKMAAHPVGQQILRERPFVNEKIVNADALRKLPEGTFGKEFTNFLDNNQVSPDTRTPVRFVDDEELAYVLLRYRHIHDYVHALLGLDISVEAEIAAKWFEMMQTGLPVTALASVFGPLRLSRPDVEHLITVWIPWALKCGAQSEFVMNIYFEKHFNMPVADLRRQLGITPAPIVS